MWPELRIAALVSMRKPGYCCWAPAKAGSMLLLVLLAAVSGALGEIDVTIKIPIAVAENSTVKMTCDYDLHDKQLYSVKWYKSHREFYRYIQKEMPPKSVFPPLAGKVDFNQSDEHSVILNNVGPELAGKYRCEVSTDTPFLTRFETSYMHVVRLPEGNVTMRAEKPRYALGDTVRANCSAPPANPPANITWTVNGLPVNSSYNRNIPARSVKNDNRTITIAGLEFELAPDSFINGRINITCRADVFHLYNEQATVFLEEERPILASVLGTRESSHSRSSASSYEGWFLALAVADVLLGSMR